MSKALFDVIVVALVMLSSGSSFLPRIVASCKMAFLVVLPATKDGSGVVVGGFVSSVIMYVAACRKNESIVTLGKSTTFGKKTMVSALSSDLVLGM